MSKESDNKAIVGRWFTDFWGATCNLGIVDELAAPDMLLQYSLHEPRRGRADIKAFMIDFRAAFPDLNFWGAAELIAEGDYVVGRWEGGGTHTGPAFSDFLMGSLPAATGRKMRFTGTTVLKLEGGQIVSEVGLDDGTAVAGDLGGKRAGAQVTVVTQSGTNGFHGSMFEFLRNSDLDARNFFDQGTVPPFKRNQFGAALGGPLRRIGRKHI